MNIFLVADTHFNHCNIIKYCKRPFYDVFDMNNTIIEKWNEVVSKDDIVYHLGDFGFGSLEELKNIFDRLNGKKNLIMGNHDYKYGEVFFKKIGFEIVEKKEIKINNIIFTHFPKHIDKNYINIYGHIHEKPISKKFDDDRHFCICLEKTNYYPIKLDDLINKE